MCNHPEVTEEEGSKACSGTSTRRGSSSSSSFSSAGLLRFKNVPDSEVMNCLQLGIRRTVGESQEGSDRDLLIQDFMAFQSVTFPTKGSDTIPPHAFVSFKFLNYAPIAFKCFRGLFKIKPESFLNSMCSESLRQLENPGASGSIFYLTHDDAFILKTVQKRETDFLLKLLPGYYLNLTQNPKTLLPKFFGFYCYNTLNRNVRIMVMNNLIPSNVSIGQKYDLKGSTSRRKATQAELRKPSPTYKDLDFLEHHPNGLLLDTETYNSLRTTLESDCRVLESFKIIDYSLLLAVHHIGRNPNHNPYSCHSDGNKEPTRGIPARTSSGEELLLFIGIIDILQSYKLRKKIEQTFKSILHERDSLSVHRPDFYSQRFQNFLLKTVFRPMTKRKSILKPPQVLGPDGKLQEGVPLSVVWTPASSNTTLSHFPSRDNLKLYGPPKKPEEEQVEEGENSNDSVSEELRSPGLGLKSANAVAVEIN